MNNFDGDLKIADIESAKEALSALTSVDSFDEMLPQPVRVSLVDFQPYEAGKDLSGQPIIRNKPVIRTAEISTYVPMKIFHGLIASQEKLNRIRKAGAEGGAPSDEMLQWMSEQVLAVWKLTEPDMTLDRLTSGLDMFKIMGLFQHFFGSLLNRANRN